MKTMSKGVKTMSKWVKTMSKGVKTMSKGRGIKSGPRFPNSRIKSQIEK